MEEDRSDDLLLGTEQVDKFQAWATKNAKKAGEWYKDASADQAGIGDDILRLLGGGAKNVAIASQLPGIKQGFQVLGAAGYYGGIVGGKAAEAVGIDPRIGGFAGNIIGDVAFGGAVAKAGKVARAVRAVDQLPPLTSGGILNPGPGAAGLKPTGLRKVSKVVKATGKQQDALIAEAKLARKELLKPRPKGTELPTREAAEEFYELTGEQALDLGFVYKNKGGTNSGKWGLDYKPLRDRQLVNRNKRLVDITESEEVFLRGTEKMEAIRAKGMDPHHIIPTHVSQKLKDSMSAAAWKRRVVADAKKGIFHGNHPRNLVAARVKKTPTHTAGKTSQVWHRGGEGGIKGYHTLESGIDWTQGIEPYRDLMIQQLKPQRQVKYRQKLAITKKTKPTQFPDNIQRHIQRSQEIGIPEPQWKSGSIDYTWRPQSGTGQIDIPPQSAKGFKGLRDEFFKQIEELPSGSVWELNPKFKDEQRRRIYARLFGKDARITRNPDPTLGWVLTVP